MTHNRTALLVTPSWQIIPVVLEDLEKVFQIYHQCEDFLALGPTPNASFEMVVNDFNHSKEVGGIFCAIYNTDGSIVGVLDFIPGGYAGDLQSAYLELLIIAQPYRSLGLGSQVVEHIEAFIRKDPQVKNIRAHVQENNPRATAFWQRLGYLVMGGVEDRPDGTRVLPLQKTWI
jgi:ribosomal protein S18 acetylase RimI-like enzyme